MGKYEDEKLGRKSRKNGTAGNVGRMVRR